MMRVLIVGDSQTKYFSRYLQQWPSDLRVTVNSKSGSRIQDITLPFDGEYDHVVLHLGTNNVPSRDRPATIAERMIKLVEEIHNKLNRADIHISSILPRCENGFKVAGSDEERIEFLNGKAIVTNVVSRQLCGRLDYCKFIENDEGFMIGSNVKRHLLSRDGLHLSPRGIIQLLGNIQRSILSTSHPAPRPMPVPSAPSFSHVPPIPCKSNAFGWHVVTCRQKIMPCSQRQLDMISLDQMIDNCLSKYSADCSSTNNNKKMSSCYEKVQTVSRCVASRWSMRAERFLPLMYLLPRSTVKFKYSPSPLMLKSPAVSVFDATVVLDGWRGSVVGKTFCLSCTASPATSETPRTLKRSVSPSSGIPLPIEEEKVIVCKNNKKKIDRSMGKKSENDWFEEALVWKQVQISKINTILQMEVVQFILESVMFVYTLIKQGRRLVNIEKFATLWNRMSVLNVVNHFQCYRPL